MKYSLICIYEIAFKLKFIKEMSLPRAFFEFNKGFQFEVFLRKTKWDIIVGNSVEMGDIFEIVKIRIGILIL